MRIIRAVFLPASVGLLIWAAAVVPLPQYVQAPGTVVPLGASIDVQDPSAGEIDGEFHMTTVNLRRATVFGLVHAGVSDTVGATLISRVVPPGMDPREYFRRERELFREAGRLAAAVGLCAAEFYDDPCQITGDGALVVEVVPGSAADGVLLPGDVVIEAAGEPVATDSDLRAAIGSVLKGGSLRLVVLRQGEELQAEVAPRPVTDVSDEPILGVGPAIMNPRIDQSVPVEIRSGRVGGPSAGLMVALTVFDKVNADVDLAAGRVIAGTGTIDIDGAVGPVGSIRFKVVGADRGGAELFLVPAGQADAARAAVPEGSDLIVVPIESLDDALAVLQADDLKATADAG
ncbi:MAG TPA: PDZ domain-containing protein [Egibacteraceae bacterium]|nr:PDZ domain-containing protein [Egibacteraceae bacterium]